jgi:hypothetical protein
MPQPADSALEVKTADGGGSKQHSKDATETAIAGTGADTAQAVDAAVAGAQQVQAPAPVDDTSTPAGATPATRTAAVASPAASVPASANLIVGASGKSEKVVAALGAEPEPPAAADDAKAERAKMMQEAAKPALAVKADQAEVAKPDTPKAKLDAPATAGKDAAASHQAKPDDAAAAQATTAAAAQAAKPDAGPDAARAVAALAQPPQANLPPTPPQMVPIEIGLQALRNGSSTFQIRLDPDELGRVEVKLHIGSDSKVSASLVVDRVDTLHLLQREAKTLERAFEQAGLKANGDDLQFSLRQDNGGQGGRQQGDTSRFASSRTPEHDDAPQPVQPVLSRLTMTRALAGGLDIQI